MSTELTPLRMESRAVSRFTGLRVHFIGIGGCGMSGLARMLLDAGAIVTGSDPNPNTQTFDLIRRGAKISRDQVGELISEQTDLVVRTAAIKDNNTEYLAALRYGKKAIKYAQLLGEVMAERYGIAVAGTHGKSTTTAMIAYALLQCEADPSFVIGGTVSQLGGGSRSGAGQAFVVEACEFDRSFHNLHPSCAIITNIEGDHFDSYPGGLQEIMESFAHFARLVPHHGRIIANGQDANTIRALGQAAAPVEWVGILDETSRDQASAPLVWSARNVRLEHGCHCGEIYHHEQPVAFLRLKVAGRHNLFNATMSVAACYAAGVDPAQAAEAINQFTGVDRRMTIIGQRNGAIILDDYGHHPTEVRVTLEAIRERYSPRRLFCIFQPHQHSRTRFLLDEFAASFAAADETIVPDIYFVRDSELEKQRVTACELVERIIDHGQLACHIPDLKKIPEYLKPRLQEGDVVVTMGAGNIWEIARELADD